MNFKLFFLPLKYISELNLNKSDKIICQIFYEITNYKLLKNLIASSKNNFLVDLINFTIFYMLLYIIKGNIYLL